MSYIILDVKSGEMDGYYKEYTNEYQINAVNALEYHKKRKPEGYWIIVKTVSNDGYPIKRWW